MTIKVEWKEDNSAVVTGRITALNGSGGETNVKGEGSWINQSDVDTITCAVFDLDSVTPETVIATPTISKTTSILNTPVTSNAIWTKDKTGYNFVHTLAASNFPTGNHTYRVEYYILTVGGEEYRFAYQGPAEPSNAS